MSGLLKDLKALNTNEDIESVLSETQKLLGAQDFNEIFEAQSSQEQEAIRSLLTSIQDRIEAYQNDLKKDALASKGRIDTANEMSDACLAYTKAKDTD